MSHQYIYVLHSIAARSQYNTSSFSSKNVVEAWQHVAVSLVFVSYTYANWCAFATINKQVMLTGTIDNASAGLDMNSKSAI